MSAPVFLGDEWTAAGWRLAGADVVVPESDAVADAFERACADRPPLVLITAELASRLEAGRLHRARAALDPPVLVVGDAPGRAKPDDIAGDIRERMGVAR